MIDRFAKALLDNLTDPVARDKAKADLEELEKIFHDVLSRRE